MKSAIAIPVISFLSLTSTVSAAPKSTASGLSDQQKSGYRSYVKAQATKADFSSVNNVLATAVPAATKAAQESDFRLAALTTDKPELPSYIKDTNDKASAYLSSFYYAQASIINKGDEKKGVQADSNTTGGANLLDDITSTAGPTKTGAKTTATGKTDKPKSTGTKKPAATKGADPAIALKSTTSGSSPTSTGVKPLETTGGPKESTSTKKDSKSTGSGTASSASSTGAAVMAQPTGVMKMAGVGMLGVAGVAAFL